MLFRGRVQGGSVVFDDGNQPPEGATVAVWVEELPQPKIDPPEAERYAAAIKQWRGWTAALVRWSLAGVGFLFVCTTFEKLSLQPAILYFWLAFTPALLCGARIVVICYRLATWRCPRCGTKHPTITWFGHQDTCRRCQLRIISGPVGARELFGLRSAEVTQNRG